MEYRCEYTFYQTNAKSYTLLHIFHTFTEFTSVLKSIYKKFFSSFKSFTLVHCHVKFRACIYSSQQKPFRVPIKLEWKDRLIWMNEWMSHRVSDSVKEKCRNLHHSTCLQIKTRFHLSSHASVAYFQQCFLVVPSMLKPNNNEKVGKLVWIKWSNTIGQ